MEAPGTARGVSSPRGAGEQRPALQAPPLLPSPRVNVSVILGHPRPDSLNHALARAAADAARDAGHRVRLHDLQAEGFDPVLPPGEEPQGASLPPLVEAHCREIAEADGIVVVHPDWWGMPPAILAGWVDRVLRPGVAYRFTEGDAGEGVPVGLLRARFALVLNTSNTPPGREARAFGDPLERIWRDCVFGLCGVARVERRTFSVVVTSSAAERAAWLGEVRALVARLVPREA
jgi:NAD(P)H dehydrogenase (quinone)